MYLCILIKLQQFDYTGAGEHRPGADTYVHLILNNQTQSELIKPNTWRISSVGRQETAAGLLNPTGAILHDRRAERELFVAILCVAAWNYPAAPRPIFEKSHSC